MKHLYKHNDKFYKIHRAIPIHFFNDKEDNLNMDLVKDGKDNIFGVDHVLRTGTHFLFVETIEDVEPINE